MRYETQDGGLASYKRNNHISKIFGKKHILKKCFLHYITTTINFFNLLHYNKKQYIFLHENIHFLINKNIFLIKKEQRNKRSGSYYFYTQETREDKEEMFWR
jgi:hypothetical protein